MIRRIELLFVLLFVYVRQVRQEKLQKLSDAAVAKAKEIDTQKLADLAAEKLKQVTPAIAK